MALFNNVRKAAPVQGFYIGVVLNKGTSYETKLDLPASNVLSLTHKRTADNMSNSFTLNLIGDLSISLEQRIITGNQKIAFSYGWEGSPVRYFHGQITSVIPEFQGGSMAISVSGVASVTNDDTVRRTCKYQKGISLKKILTLICNYHKWELGFYVDSKNLTEDVYQTDCSDLKFLTSILPEYLATRDTGNTNYKLWFTYKGSKLVLNYAPIEYKVSESKFKFTYDVMGSSNSKLVSFQVKNLGEVAYSVGSSVTAVGFSDDGLMFANSSEAPDGTKIDTINKSALLSSTSAQTAKNRANQYWMKLNEASFTADATFLGETELEIGDECYIIVNLPGGSYHYTSGTYKVIEIEDILDSNGFLTKAKLVKVNKDIGGY